MERAGLDEGWSPAQVHVDVVRIRTEWVLCTWGRGARTQASVQ